MQEDLAGNLGATQMKIAGLDHQEFSTEQSEKLATIVPANRDDLCHIEPMISDNVSTLSVNSSMAFGVAQWPEAEGRLLFHEYAPGQEQAAPGALAAWRYLLRL